MTLKLDTVAKMAILRYVDERIADLHLALEGHQDVAETSMLRGQVRELRLLRAEFDDKRPLPQIAGVGIPMT